MRTLHNAGWLSLLPSNPSPTKRTVESIKDPIYRFVFESTYCCFDHGIDYSSWLKYKPPISCSQVAWVPDLLSRVKQLSNISKALGGAGAKMLKSITLCMAAAGKTVHSFVLSKYFSLLPLVSEIKDQSGGIKVVRDPFLLCLCGDIESNPGPSQQFFNPVKTSKFLSSYPDIQPEEILTEYTTFIRNLNPNLIVSEKTEVIKKVQFELGIDCIMANLSKLNFNKILSIGTGHEIIEHLGIYWGKSLKFLCPPVTECLLCSKPLTKNNPPTQIVFHTVPGPQTSSQSIYSCRA